MNPTRKVLRINPDFGQMDEAVLLKNLREGAPNARQMALTALAERLPQASYLADTIFEAIEKTENQQAIVMGAFTVSMVGAMAMLESGDTATYARLKQIIYRLPVVQRTDLFDYLKLAAKFDYETLLNAA